MEKYFNVGDLDVERLLRQWRWLVRNSVMIVARNNFGDLFLRELSGTIWKLDVSGGTYGEIAASEAEFRENAEQNLESWFASSDEEAAARKGLVPGPLECIAFKIPLMFAESGTPDNACVGDLYETVAFLGHVHQETASLPDGAAVRFKIK